MLDVHAMVVSQVVGATKGKLELDVGKIRERQRTVGSVYVPKGPHAQTTAHPGLGAIKSMLANLPTSSALTATVKDLQSSDTRLRLIETLPKPLYGTSRSASPAATQALGDMAAATPLSGNQSTSVAGTADVGSGTLSTGRRRSIASSPLLPDFGSPPLSQTQKWLMRKQQEAGFSGRRPKLDRISMADVQAAVIGRDALRDTLYCLCLIADWNPVCRRLEPQLQTGRWLIEQAAAADPAGPGPRIKLLQVDASEANTLQARYKFKSVPMFLMFFEGKLVNITNNISSAEELKAACFAGLEKGRRGDVLPEHYGLAGLGNSMLDYITSDMVLRT